jgi:hypothetical protein
MSLSIDEQRTLLDFYYRSFAGDVALASGVDLSGSGLSQSAPLQIFDLTGQPLFLDFEITTGSGQSVGVVRSSARGSELTMLDAILIGKRLFEPTAAKTAVLRKAAQDHPGATLGDPVFVCYGYPGIGVLVPVRTADASLTVVYDAHSCFLVSCWAGNFTAAESGLQGDEPEGLPFYSYAARLPESGDDSEVAKDWGRGIALYETSIASHSELGSDSVLTPTMSPLVSSVLGNPPPPSAPTYKGLESGLLPLAQQPIISGSLLPIPLIGQETPSYCAVATAQMILEYLGFGGFTQTEIAQAMETGPQGTFNAGMIAGYKRLTGGKWTATLDETPAFSEAVSIVNRSLPAKSAIPRHARVLRGWREYRYVDRRSGQVKFNQQFLVINDPYPVNSGQFVLENVTKPIDRYYRNFLYVEPAPSPPNPIPTPATPGSGP